jgi:hypothetical protein
VLFYRDGVSDSQYAAVRDVEYRGLQQVRGCAALGMLLGMLP